MKIIISPDSFKGSMSTMSAAAETYWMVARGEMIWAAKEVKT